MSEVKQSGSWYVQYTSGARSPARYWSRRWARDVAYRLMRDYPELGRVAVRRAVRG